MPGSTTLKKITARAKQIRKKHGGSWKQAVKAAGREYRGGKISGTRTKRKSTVKRKSVSRTTHHRRRHKISGGVVSIAGPKSPGFNAGLEKTRDQVHEELGWALAAQRTARTKTEKKKLQPRIDQLTKILRSLQGK